MKRKHKKLALEKYRNEKILSKGGIAYITK